jgi:hypothetical protein
MVKRSKNINTLAILGIILLVLTGIFTFEESPYLDRNEAYVVRSEKPMGLSVFYDLMRQLKGDSNVTIDRDFSPYTADSTLYTYVSVDNDLYFSDGYIEEMLIRGNTVIVIANNIQGLDSAWVKSDTLAYEIPTYGLIDTFVFNDKDSIFVPVDFAFNLPYGINIKDIYADTVLLYGENFPVFQVRNIGEGTLIVHNCPYLFTNFAAKRQHFLKHLNMLTPYLNDNIVFSHPTKDDKANTSGLLAQIFKKPGLKYAYYLMLAMVLCYLVLSGKRIQNIIPVIAPKKNLTASYVDTISRLYQSQDQKLLLLDRIKDNFYHYVLKNFYINHQDPDFVSQLSKRTSVPEYTIKMILKLSNKEVSTTITDDHILTLNQYIQQFKSIAYNGR